MTYASISRSVLFALLITVGSSLALSALAQEPQEPLPGQKVGFVELARIFSGSKMAKASEEQLRKEFEVREQELVALNNNLKTAINAFDRDANTLTEIQFNQRRFELQQLDQVFQNKRDLFQESLNNRKNEELIRLQEAANLAIRDFAERENYAYILIEAAYVNPALDITDQILKMLNNTTVPGFSNNTQ